MMCRRRRRRRCGSVGCGSGHAAGATAAGHWEVAGGGGAGHCRGHWSRTREHSEGYVWRRVHFELRSAPAGYNGSPQCPDSTAVPERTTVFIFFRHICSWSGALQSHNLNPCRTVCSPAYLHPQCCRFVTAAMMPPTHNCSASPQGRSRACGGSHLGITRGSMSEDASWWVRAVRRFASPTATIAPLNRLGPASMLISTTPICRTDCHPFSAVMHRCPGGKVWIPGKAITTTTHLRSELHRRAPLSFRGNAESSVPTSPADQQVQIEATTGRN